MQQVDRQRVGALHEDLHLEEQRQQRGALGLGASRRPRRLLVEHEQRWQNVLPRVRLERLGLDAQVGEDEDHLVEELVVGVDDGRERRVLARRRVEAHRRGGGGGGVHALQLVSMRRRERAGEEDRVIASDRPRVKSPAGGSAQRCRGARRLAWRDIVNPASKNPQTKKKASEWNESVFVQTRLWLWYRARSTLCAGAGGRPGQRERGRSLAGCGLRRFCAVWLQ